MAVTQVAAVLRRVRVEGAAGPGALRTLRPVGSPLNLHKDRARSKTGAARPLLWLFLWQWEAAQLPRKEHPGWESGRAGAGLRELRGEGS